MGACRRAGACSGASTRTPAPTSATARRCGGACSTAAHAAWCVFEGLSVGRRTVSWVTFRCCLLVVVAGRSGPTGGAVSCSMYAEALLTCNGRSVKFLCTTDPKPDPGDPTPRRPGTLSPGQLDRTHADAEQYETCRYTVDYAREASRGSVRRVPPLCRPLLPLCCCCAAPVCTESSLHKEGD